MNRRQRRAAGAGQRQGTAPGNNPQHGILLQQALMHHQAGRFFEAEKIYRSLLSEYPDNADALHLLGLLEEIKGRREEAAKLIAQALELQPQFAQGYSNLGNIYMGMGKLEEAARCHEKCIALMPGYAEAYTNLGNVKREMGRREEAVEWHRKALAVNPRLQIAYSNLATALQELGRSEEAAAALQQLLDINPQDIQALNTLGILHSAAGRHKEAIASYEAALRQQPDFPLALNNLGSSYLSLQRLEKAAECFGRATALKPDFAEAWVNLALVRYQQSDMEEGAQCCRRALAIRRIPSAALMLALSVPPVSPSREAIAEYRRKMMQELEILLAGDDQIRDPLQEQGLTGFYLAYQGEDDRQIQEMLAKFFLQACPALSYTAPHCGQDEVRKQSARIKIGFCSTHFYNHTIGKLMEGIIARLPREYFEVVLFTVGGKQDPMVDRLHRAADKVIVLPRKALAPAQQAVAAEKLDILYYPDIGMDPFTYFLAFARLAPVQCVSWGHPDTTGIPNMDYFISPEDAEPKGAEAFYTERLVKMKELPTYYYRPDFALSSHGRDYYHLPEDKHLYLIPQSLFKLHPDFDETLLKIAEKDPQAIIVLIEGLHGSWGDLLRQRLIRRTPSLLPRLRFMPRMKLAEFMRLMQLADAVLDPQHFGGGNTSYEAFVAGVPVVTWPGRFMRGRVTYACYRKMDVMDLVANSQEDYVEKAVRLASDKAWHIQMRNLIANKSNVLYENMKAIDELSGWLQSLFK